MPSISNQFAVISPFLPASQEARNLESVGVTVVGLVGQFPSPTRLATSPFETAAARHQLYIFAITGYGAVLYWTIADSDQLGSAATVHQL